MINQLKPTFIDKAPEWSKKRPKSENEILSWPKHVKASSSSNRNYSNPGELNVNEFILAEFGFHLDSQSVS